MGWFYREVRWGYFAVRDVVEPLSEMKIGREGVEITVDLPGVTRENLMINASEDAILVEAVSLVGGARVKYKKLIKMPFPIDPERVKARLTHGILHIVAPPKEVGFRRVPVE
ncbi:MAG: hypothetical protein DRN78_01560 [Thermoproteota archaeon]|nr:Hsp20/alpha crystallin family protein [Candidatus Korarchaeota archaeon]RLG43620.1 MAG: hypothetical protein DRN78_01560 [Candidatus Korarchaeota archaeon]